MEPRRPLPIPPPPPEPPPLKARFALIFTVLLVVGMVGGVIYFYTKGADGTLAKDMMVESGLRQTGMSLWTNGTTPGLRNFDDDLVKTVKAMRDRYTGLPEISIAPVVADESGKRTGTHRILFGVGGPPFLTVTVNVDLTMGTADILSHTTPDPVDLSPDASMDPAEKLLRDFGKRKTEPETPGNPESAPSVAPEPAPSSPEKVTPVPDPAAEETAPAPPPVPEKVSEEPRKGDE